MTPFKIKNIAAFTLLVFNHNIHAASLYVDNVASCAGLTTCYVSIQEALNNAVSDDEIRVFPGVYSEAVDLSLMGSALGPAADGNIQFITVDSNNISTAGTVQMTPVSGAAFLHSGSFFAGDVTIDGFVVLSVDDDGIDLDLIDGDITVSHVTANGNNADGIDLEVAAGGHTIDVNNSITNDNQGNGVNLDGPANTQVNVMLVQANNNTDEGIDIDSAASTDALQISIIDSESLNNGDDLNDSAGTVVESPGTLVVNNLISNNNRGPGLAIIDMVSTQVSDSTLNNNAIVEGFSGIFLISAGEIEISRTIFSDNGFAGINLFETNIVGNELTDFNVNCSTFSGNDMGVFLNNSVVDTADYTIQNNNFGDQITAAIHAGVNNDGIVAIDNWWSDATGPTHVDNPMGTGERVSDSLDDVVGGAEGTVGYTPFATAPIDVIQFASDTIFANGFDGGVCTQF